MKIKFYGAASEVGRSCIRIETKESKILLDCGIKMSEPAEFPLIPDEKLIDLDAILISHAHLDHCGYLAHALSVGFKGKIYATKPTFELANILINDYIKISNPDNITKEGCSKLPKQFSLKAYHEVFTINDIKVKFLEAGHVLGSAMIELELKNEKLLYTGDVNFRTTKLLDPGYSKDLSEVTLITESTYGGDEDMFPSEKITLSNMASSITETLKSNSKVIIPSFGIGRAQEVVFILNDYIRSGIIPSVPIYMDGMVNKAMKIHRHNVIYCRDELQKRILMNDDDPFKSKNFVHVLTIKERKKLIKSTEPCIIVTTSGMLSGGPVLKYLENLGHISGNKLIFVGYQAEGTRGRQLLDGNRIITIGKKKVNVKLTIERYNLSAHADRQQLLHFISKIKNLKNIFIVHGEKIKSEQLKASISKKYNVVVPSLLDEFSV
ncbi:MAG: MBL fold metallo-hydrolase RNA specificity domain-containing protein [Candidatus Micrarchaeaceae archaeon]